MKSNKFIQRTNAELYIKIKSELQPVVDRIKTAESFQKILTIVMGSAATRKLHDRFTNKITTLDELMKIHNELVKDSMETNDEFITDMARITQAAIKKLKDIQ